MSLLTELFGTEIISAPLEEVKELIRNVPSKLFEKKSYLLKDFAAIRGIELTKEDFEDIGV